MAVYKIKVRGKVQGVFFRDYTKRKADELGIKGTVQNMPDGSVEINANDNEELQQFIDWLWEGSPASNVEDVEVEKLVESKNFSSFEVLH